MHVACAAARRGDVERAAARVRQDQPPRQKMQLPLNGAGIARSGSCGADRLLLSYHIWDRR